MTRRAGGSCPGQRRSPGSGSSRRRGATTPWTRSPPAGPDPGLLLLIVAGIGLAALVVDTLAAGLDLPGMTLIPLAALFAVPWLVNRGSAPWWAFPLVALGWLAVLSALQRDRASQVGTWCAGRLTGDRPGHRGNHDGPGPGRGRADRP